MEIEVDFQIMQTLKILREDMYQAVNRVIAGRKKSIYILSNSRSFTLLNKMYSELKTWYDAVITNK